MKTTTLAALGRVVERLTALGLAGEANALLRADNAAEAYVGLARAKAAVVDQTCCRALDEATRALLEEEPRPNAAMFMAALLGGRKA